MAHVKAVTLDSQYPKAILTMLRKVELPELWKDRRVWTSYRWEVIDIQAETYVLAALEVGEELFTQQKFEDASIGTISMIQQVLVVR